MDHLKSYDDASRAFFALTKSTDENILGFYVEGLAVTLKWVKIREGSIVGSRDLSLIEAELFGITLTQTSEGIPKVNFKIDIFDAGEKSSDYYLINDPLNEGHVALFYLSSQGPALIREAYVDLDNSLAYCKCQKETGEQFVETKKVDLGPLSFFMKK